MAEADIEMDNMAKDTEDTIDDIEKDTEDLSEEERSKMEKKAAKARRDVQEFSRVREFLKPLADMAKTYLPKVAMFIGQNIAMGVILWGVNKVLNKTSHQDPQKSSDVKKKVAAINALITVIKTQGDLGKKTFEWMKEHKDEVITLDETDVPLESVISKYITPISESVDAAFKIAQKLKYKLDGEVQFNIPTGEDMREFLTAGDAFLKGYSDLVAFIPTKVQKIEQLATFPVKQADIDLLTTQLKDAKHLPLW
ncbi:uncharacterized protein LOC129347274 [Amphiprion ocellaris]|uniref:uncharacterized protein LOC111588840 n=1 Tax=Amphiprion ocellaris TaxID=80972 RepID=UPI000C3072DA|nr:uncharacterized protein LOC111588840 [Amphiprion ocellaris]XP_054869874.1 uncharacterized protein LOC129347274 [Amphiprion ocellaris]